MLYSVLHRVMAIFHQHQLFDFLVKMARNCVKCMIANLWYPGPNRPFLNHYTQQ